MSFLQSSHVAFLTWGAVFCVLTALSVICSLSLGELHRRRLMCIELLVSLFAISDAAAVSFNARAGALARVMAGAGSFLVFFLAGLIALVYNGYVMGILFPGDVHSMGDVILPGRNRTALPKRSFLISLIAVACMILAVVSNFTGLYYTIDESNAFHFAAGFPLHIIILSFAGALELSLIIENREKLKRRVYSAIIAFVLLPLSGLLGILLPSGISYAGGALAVSAVYLFFVTVYEEHKELNDTRLAVTLSQIKPHFLYNAITAIQELCLTDPVRAASAMGDFADYMRGNMEALSKNRCIPFHKELEHTRKYLSIEKERFGDRLSIEYDTVETGFLIPPLTIQPLVENAVKHGVTKKECGGTVRIRSYRAPGCYVVLIEDDGVGFSEIPKDGRQHVGVANVKSRLQSMRGGTLEVSSTPGVGTVCEIRLPDTVAWRNNVEEIKK